MAPISSGPTCSRDSMSPPAPAAMPISGMPTRLAANRKSTTKKMIPGRNTATIADPTLPALSSAYESGNQRAKYWDPEEQDRDDEHPHHRRRNAALLVCHESHPLKPTS